MPVLMLNSGPGITEPKELALDADEIIVGRAPECHVVLSFAAVSRRHARITREGTQYFIEDTSTRGGTILNGDVARAFGLPKTLLKHGDEIRILTFVAVFQDQPTD